jgi:hypothetical protein
LAKPTASLRADFRRHVKWLQPGSLPIATVQLFLLALSISELFRQISLTNREFTEAFYFDYEVWQQSVGNIVILMLSLVV